MQTINEPRIDLQAIVLIPVMTVILAGFCYGYARMVRRGGALTQTQKSMILFACLFSFGMGYAIVFQEQLSRIMHWKQAWVATVVLWGALLGLFAYRKCRRAV